MKISKQNKTKREKRREKKSRLINCRDKLKNTAVRGQSEEMKLIKLRKKAKEDYK